MGSPRRHRTRSQCSHTNRLSQFSSQQPELPPGDSCQSVYCDLPPESPIQWKHGVCPNTPTLLPFGEADLEMPLSISFLDAVTMPPHMINKSDYQFTRCARVMRFNAPLKMCGPARPPQSDDSDSSYETRSSQHQLRTRSCARTQHQQARDSSTAQQSTDRLRKIQHLSSSMLSKETASANSQKWSQSFTKTAIKVNHLMSLCLKLKDSQNGTEVNKSESPVANQPSTKNWKKQNSALQASQRKVRPEVVKVKSHVEESSLGSCICHVDRGYFGQVSPARTSDTDFSKSSSSPKVIREVICQNAVFAKNQANAQHLCERGGNQLQQQLSVCETDDRTPMSQSWESALTTSDKNYPSCCHPTDVRCQLQDQSYLASLRAWLTSQLEPSGSDDLNQLLSQLASAVHDGSHAPARSQNTPCIADMEKDSLRVSRTRSQCIPDVTDSVLDCSWEKPQAQPAASQSIKCEDRLQMLLEAVIIILARGNRKMNERTPSENSGGRGVPESSLSQETKVKPNNAENVNKYFTSHMVNSNHQYCEHSTMKWQDASNPQQSELSTKQFEHSNQKYELPTQKWQEACNHQQYEHSTQKCGQSTKKWQKPRNHQPYEHSIQKWQEPSNPQQCEHSTQKHKTGCQLLPRPVFVPASNSCLRWPSGIDEEVATQTEQAGGHNPTDTSYESSSDVNTAQTYDMSQVKQTPKKTILVLRKQTETSKTCDQQTVRNSSQQTQYVPVKKSHKQDKCTHVTVGGHSGSGKAQPARADPAEDSWFQRMASNKNEQFAATEVDFLAFMTRKLDTTQHKLAKKLLDKWHTLPHNPSESMINGHLRFLQQVFEITKQHARKQFAQWLKSGRELAGDN